MWTCPNCKEKVEDTFGTCWNCGTDVEGHKNPLFVHPEAAARIASSPTRQATTGKIKELGIFATGIGVIFATLVLYLNFMSPAKRPTAQLLVVLAIPATFIVAGVLTLLMRTKPVIIGTATLVVIGFAVDLLLTPNPIKILISAGIALLVVRTANQALAEVDRDSESRKAPVQS